MFDRYTKCPSITLVVALALLSTGCPVGGTFELRVKRHFDTPEEEGLIQTAESVYPPREDVEAVWSPPYGAESPTPPDEPLWWCDSFDTTRIPYAITGDAVEYYTDLMLQWRENPQTASGITMYKGYFYYDAYIAHHDHFEFGGESFDDVHVVTMAMSWHQWCGMMCALWFTKERTVVLDTEGEVLRIFGDGPISYVVS